MKTPSVNNGKAYKILSFPSKTKPFRIIVSTDGKRRAIYFSDLAEAKKKQKDLIKFGPGILRDPDEVKAGAEVQENIGYWNYLVEQYNLSADEVHAALKRHAELAALKPATVREALNSFYEYRKGIKLSKGRKLSKGTLNSDRTRLLSLDREFGRHKMGELTKGLLLEYLDNRGANALSVYKSLSVFLNWAIDKNYIKENPLGRKPKTLGSYGVHNDYYKIETFRSMLRICAGLDAVQPGAEPTREFIDLLPWLIVSGFAGLRTKEAVRTACGDQAIEWRDLLFDNAKPHLWVREEIAKKTDRQSGDERPVDFPYAVEAMRAWLALVPRREGNPFVVPCTIRTIHQLKGRFTKATSITFTDNGLRNSFGTYAFSYSGESALGQVAKQMGTSETIARRHYVRNLPAGTGREWFDLRPFEVVERNEKIALQTAT